MAWLSNLFDRNKELEPADLSVLKTDIHSHLIPGIDDGSKSMEESLELILELKKLGYQKIITTPHIQQDQYKNTPEIINDGLEALRNALKQENISMDIEAASEYLIDDGFRDKLETGNLLTFAGKHVLIELSYYSEPFNLKNLFFDLQTSGYKVVLAHPERYVYWHRKPEMYQDLFDRGIILQLNLASLTGFYSVESKETAEHLIDKNLIRLLGTDTHHKNYFPAFYHALKSPYLHKLLNSNSLQNNKL